MAAPFEQKTPNRRRLVLIGAGGLIVLVAAIAFFFPRAPKSLWAPTTQLVGDCGDACIDLGTHNFAHAGDVQFFYDPDVDDPVAQWAGCLDTILACVSEGSGDNPKLLGSCVTASSCPETCKNKFTNSLKSTDSAQGQLDKFEKVFLEDDAKCKPQE